VWHIYALWAGYTFTTSGDIETVIEGTSRIEQTSEGWAPIATVRGDSPIIEQLEGVSVFEQEG
jgi:hypothetical protein